VLFFFIADRVHVWAALPTGLLDPKPEVRREMDAFLLSAGEEKRVSLKRIERDLASRLRYKVFGDLADGVGAYRPLAGVSDLLKR
jgi:hypothetical protein